MEKNYNIKVDGLPNIDLNLKISNINLNYGFNNDNNSVNKSNVISCNVELTDNITKVKINTEYHDSIQNFRDFIKKHIANWQNRHFYNNNSLAIIGFNSTIKKRYKFDISSILCCLFSDISLSDYTLYDFLIELGYNENSEQLKKGIEMHEQLQSFKTMQYLYNIIIEYCYNRDLYLENCFTIIEIN